MSKVIALHENIGKHLCPTVNFVSGQLPAQWTRIARRHRKDRSTAQDELPRTQNRQNRQRAVLLSTLRLHPGADQSQRVAGQLAARAGDGAAAEQHQDAGVGRVFAVAGQPQVLQALVGGDVGQGHYEAHDLEQR